MARFRKTAEESKKKAEAWNMGHRSQDLDSYFTGSEKKHCCKISRKTML